MTFYKNPWMHLLIWSFFSSNEEIDADGAFKNVKVRNKKESPIPPFQEYLPMRPQVVKHQRNTINFNN